MGGSGGPGRSDGSADGGIGVREKLSVAYQSTILTDGIGSGSYMGVSVMSWIVAHAG